MMYQKIVVPVDHGNRNLKTKNYVFTSGILESDCKPVLGEYMYYNRKYYSLSEQRIPYMRDKSSDERFFILTLFGNVKEAEKLGMNPENTLLQAELLVGLPPKHYGALLLREYLEKSDKVGKCIFIENICANASSLSSVPIFFSFSFMFSFLVIFVLLLMFNPPYVFGLSCYTSTLQKCLNKSQILKIYLTYIFIFFRVNSNEGKEESTRFIFFCI